MRLLSVDTGTDKYYSNYIAFLNITFPRGYSKFKIMDIWNNHVFISDEINHIALCKMIMQ